MLSKSDEEILDDRLKNWGRWAADSTHGRVNWIYRMMLLSGEIQLSASDKRRIDLPDALLVQRAWRMLPQSPLRYKTAKWVIVAHYAYPQLSVWRFCKCMRIRPREYEELLSLARCMIHNIINQQAGKKLTTI